MAFNSNPRKTGIIILLILLAALTAYVFWMVYKGNHKAVRYGAVAVSQSSLDYGTAFDYADANAAAQRSLSECNKRTAAQDCSVRMSLAGNCGAMAMSANAGQTFVAIDADVTMARVFALAQCQAAGASDCVVHENFCSDNPR